ncbi:class I SAM-dependent methyltransferase [candidate division KSB1 bacterium]
MKNKFIDYYSHRSAIYARYRPKYPPELFSYLASISPQRNTAWDCATGSGQAATGLTAYFKNTFASDPSKGQIANADRCENLHYFISSAERVGMRSHSVDLVTVAQAIHWFDFDLFYGEIERILKKNGILAFWSYNLLTIDHDIDKIINKFYWETLKGYWPVERRFIDEDYMTVPLPFAEMISPVFNMAAEWDIDQFTGYLSSWSAVHIFREKHGRDPFDLICNDLKNVWGNRGDSKIIKWPLNLRIGINS